MAEIYVVERPFTHYSEILGGLYLRWPIYFVVWLQHLEEYQVEVVTGLQVEQFSSLKW